jgi:hypothetical protein
MRAQQHEKSRLSLSLSFLPVLPPPTNADVPLRAMTIVSFAGPDEKTCPRMPSSSQPNEEDRLYDGRDVSFDDKSYHPSSCEVE